MVNCSFHFRGRSFNAAERVKFREKWIFRFLRYIVFVLHPPHSGLTSIYTKHCNAFFETSAIIHPLHSIPMVPQNHTGSSLPANYFVECFTFGRARPEEKCSIIFHHTMDIVLLRPPRCPSHLLLFLKSMHQTLVQPFGAFRPANQRPIALQHVDLAHPVKNCPAPLRMVLTQNREVQSVEW